jgi:cell division protein FtsN
LKNLPSPTGNAISETTQVTVPVQQKAIEVTLAENKKEGLDLGDWAVQVIAVKTQKRATIHQEQLVVAGFPTYTIHAHVRGTDWILVRTGFFKSEGEAREVGEKIQRTVSILKGPYWITKVSAEEKSRLLGNRDG